MHAVGIIAEYNPFHSGHEYHLKEAKKKSGMRTIFPARSGFPAVRMRS